MTLLVLAGAVIAAVVWYRREQRRDLRVAEAERRYRTLIQNAPVGIFLTHSSGRVLRLNRTMARLLEFDEAEEALAHYSDITHELYADPDRRRRFLAELREHGEVNDFVVEALTRSGRCVWLQLDAVRREIEPDGGFAIDGFCRDVTARREAREELRRKQEMLERTERLARIGSWEIDRTSGRISWSPEMFRIMGMDPEQGAPRLEEHARLMSREDMARLEEAVARAWRDGKDYDMELEIHRPDGETRVVRARGYPETSPGGGRRRLVGFAMDVTRQVQAGEAEKALRRQLMEAQKMESVGRLAGGVAHDFNNMLSIILGNVELAMQKVAGPSPLHDDLADIQVAAERSATLTRQLLAFARRQMIQPRVVDLNEVVGGMLSILRRLIDENVELRWEPAPELGRVELDPSQMDQVLTNLVVNARDSIQGAGVVAIRTRNARVDEDGARLRAEVVPGEYVVLAVSDTGSGMSPEVMSRIFDPFFTTKPLGEGTGLGLAMVHGVVRQHEGHVGVESTVGQGSTFELYFPRVVAPVEDDDEPAAESPAATPGLRETVLVVEDQPEVLRLAQKFLEGLGYSVRTATTPQEALDGWSDDSPVDLLLTDVILPGMDGLELSRRLETRTPGLRTVYMSGYTADVLADRGMVDRHVTVVEKPFSLARLDRALREALDDQEPRR